MAAAGVVSGVADSRLGTTLSLGFCPGRAVRRGVTLGAAACSASTCPSLPATFVVWSPAAAGIEAGETCGATATDDAAGETATAGGAGSVVIRGPAATGGGREGEPDPCFKGTLPTLGLGADLWCSWDVAC